ncbi:M20 aminoacylase family protein [Paenirhodobacter populi]|uniref:Amidohydrolase n=1 Tax=Paenirhodobacter populi TaxID=2306993 RepID=A0A443J4G4_9RHOB|nr:M20 aminoacylase family protein [Sinirhodobacter populi]RWR15551.1 amidohydrolase [Sinirhodobacter populi]
MPIRNRFSEMLPEMTAWRHDFHEHPELLYDLPRTSARVADLLRGFGCDEVVTGIAQTGVVGVIRGRGPGRVVGLRADMDALPIGETTGRAYASHTPGRMHACGHDGHMTMLLGAAKYLAGTRNFDGTVVVIFQPAEEGGGGGLAMVQDGLFARWNIQEVYGMHNHPGLPVGHFAIRPGAIMASADSFEIVLTGKGGHAARPHLCVDTMVVAAQVITALQTVVSRGVDPMEQAVLSVSTITTDSPAYNVLPQVVRMSGTARTMSESVRGFIETRVKEIVTGVATALQAQAEVIWQSGYPVTVNGAAETDHAIAAARAVSADVDADVAPQMAAEDFSYMLRECPGAYILLGNGASAPVHHPDYDFDDAALPFGASWYVEIAENRLGAPEGDRHDLQSR